MDLSEILYNRKPTKTREGLPIITKETVTAFVRGSDLECESRDASNPLLEEWASEIREENPELAKYILNLISEDNPEERGKNLAYIMSIYELLKSQALNDKIKKDYGIT